MLVNIMATIITIILNYIVQALFRSYQIVPGPTMAVHGSSYNSGYYQSYTLGAKCAGSYLYINYSMI